MLDHQTDIPGPAPTSPSTDHDVSLAPRAGDLLSLPFDQYGRMRVVQNIAHVLYRALVPDELADERPRVRVLDVGGYPGILRNFLSPELFELTVLDVVRDDGTIPGYVQASGADIPFGPGEFDVVFSLDTLEHIPGQHRRAFLQEAMRVARHAVVLVNPIQSVEADLAEELLDEYIRWILDAQQEQLAEHRAFGLPDFAATRAEFEQAGMNTYAFNLANVHNWLFMMVAKHYLISMRDERASAFERALDRYYNLTFFESDRAEPAYRGALVAVRPGLEGVLEELRAAYPPLPDSEPANNAVRLQLTELLMSLLNLKTANHEDRLLRDQIEAREKNIAALEQKVALQDIELDRRENDIGGLQERVEQLEAHAGNIQAAFTKEFDSQKTYIERLQVDLQSKDEHILYLERLLQGIESGRVFRLTRKLSRFLGR
jgi:2-polyprenyl-3-methyl-5-hydroxy-6-metoxy-1,4-benzoquinol methylase